MSEEEKEQLGDGSDDYSEGAKKASEAFNKFREGSEKENSGSGTEKGGDSASNNSGSDADAANEEPPASDSASDSKANQASNNDIHNADARTGSQPSAGNGPATNNASGTPGTADNNATDKSAGNASKNADPAAHTNNAQNAADKSAGAASKGAESGANAAAGAQNAAQKGAEMGANAAASGAEATAAAAAATVKAGVEAGKAVAEIATGTAAGGPIGAAIMAAWSMRHTLFRILIFVCLILMFLVTIIVSLPSIVFNYVFKTDPAAVESSESSDMYTQFEDSSIIVSQCVTAGYDYALAEVERIISEGGYNYDYSMQALINYGLTSADYDICYVLAAYSVSMEQRGTKKEDMISKLESVKSQMFSVTYEVKETTVIIPAADEDSEPSEEVISYVECTIHPFDQSVIITAFQIDISAKYNQYNITCGEAIINMANALKLTMYGSAGNSNIPPITDSYLSEFLLSLSCSQTRLELMRAALSLVGRVPYFWGGKSAAGWNNEWNTPKLVTSLGSSTTGTIRPYGLDCSGFTDWVYKTALGKTIGVGSIHQWDNSTAITKEQLLPGDLGFMDVPGAVDVNHVLMYAGENETGDLMWVHCEYGVGVVLSSPDYVKYYRRVKGINLEASYGPSAVFTAMEIEWLTALIYYESRGMNSYCKELTGQVAVNRVNSSKFPNTLELVLKQPGQYGYGNPNLTATLIFDRKYVVYMGTAVWDSCYEAARKVAYGLSKDENGNKWPADVLYQHSFVDKDTNGIGHFKTYTSGIYWMHFNYG